MLRTVVLALLLAAMGASTLGSCTTGAGREDVAIQRFETALCDKQVECECQRSTEQACGDWPILAFEGSELQRSELAFDAACQERWLAWLDTVPCSAPTTPRYSDLCPLYHGTIRAGMDCQFAGILLETDCERDLLCIGGICRDPRTTSVGGVGEPCEYLDTCVEGTRCRLGVCSPLPGPGEPCLDFECSANAVCDGDVCQPVPLVGEACMFDMCIEGAYCDVDPSTQEGECRRLGDTGDPCTGHRQCHSGNCPAGACEDPAKPGDPCGPRLPCGPDSTCSEGTCQVVVGDGVPIQTACELVDGVLANRFS